VLSHVFPQEVEHGGDFMTPFAWLHCIRKGRYLGAEVRAPPYQ
jgi:hypothetical protein